MLDFSKKDEPEFKTRTYLNGRQDKKNSLH